MRTGIPLSGDTLEGFVDAKPALPRGTQRSGAGLPRRQREDPRSASSDRIRRTSPACLRIPSLR